MTLNSPTEKTIHNHQSTIINPLGLEGKARVLKERARALAKQSKGIEGEGAYLEVVEFMLAHERYALELTHISEVYPLKELTPLPGTPDFVLGIINVRGQILSIVDIKKFFELPEKELTNLNQVIILQSEEMEFGILADEILGTRSIPASAIQTSLPTLTGIREKYLKGVIGDGVVILDGEKILSDDSLLIR
jgi:purine-binding chemotaxis protein CheW